MTFCDENVTSHLFVTVPHSNPGPGSGKISARNDPHFCFCLFVWVSKTNPITGLSSQSFFLSLTELQNLSQSNAHVHVTVIFARLDKPVNCQCVSLPVARQGLSQGCTECCVHLGVSNKYMWLVWWFLLFQYGSRGSVRSTHREAAYQPTQMAAVRRTSRSRGAPLPRHCRFAKGSGVGGLLV